MILSSSASHKEMKMRVCSSDVRLGSMDDLREVEANQWWGAEGQTGFPGTQASSRIAPSV